MTNIPRRAVIAAIPALTIAATAISRTVEDNTLASLCRRLQANREAMPRLFDALQELEQQVFKPGCKHYMPAFDRYGAYLLDGPEYREKYEAAESRAGLDPLKAANEQNTQDWDEIMREIAATPAEGIAVKARVLAKDSMDGTTRHTEDIAASLVADLDRLEGAL